MTHEKDRRAGRTYVEPGELTARERARDLHRQHRSDPADGESRPPEGDPVADGGEGSDPEPHPSR